MTIDEARKLYIEFRKINPLVDELYKRFDLRPDLFAEDYRGGYERSDRPDSDGKVKPKDKADVKESGNTQLKLF